MPLGKLWWDKSDIRGMLPHTLRIFRYRAGCGVLDQMIDHLTKYSIVLVVRWDSESEMYAVLTLLPACTYVESSACSPLPAPTWITLFCTNFVPVPPPLFTGLSCKWKHADLNWSLATAINKEFLVLYYNAFTDESFLSWEVGLHVLAVDLWLLKLSENVKFTFLLH